MQTTELGSTMLQKFYDFCDPYNNACNFCDLYDNACPSLLIDQLLWVIFMSVNIETIQE